MVKKVHKSSADSAADSAMPAGSPLSGMVKESASQIWLAGLGAFAKAQEEGGKVFDALVKEGLSLQRKTQASAEEKITEATGKMAGLATDISSRASGQWDKLENIFEERVSRSMHRLGVPSASEFAALAARLDAVERQLRGGSARPASAARRSAPAETPAAAKAPARRAPRKSA